MLCDSLVAPIIWFTHLKCWKDRSAWAMQSWLLVKGPFGPVTCSTSTLPPQCSCSPFPGIYSILVCIFIVGLWRNDQGDRDFWLILLIAASLASRVTPDTQVTIHRLLDDWHLRPCKLYSKHPQTAIFLIPTPSSLPQSKPQPSHLVGPCIHQGSQAGDKAKNF